MLSCSKVREGRLVCFKIGWGKATKFTLSVMLTSLWRPYGLQDAKSLIRIRFRMCPLCTRCAVWRISNFQFIDKISFWIFIAKFWTFTLNRQSRALFHRWSYRIATVILVSEHTFSWFAIDNLVAAADPWLCHEVKLRDSIHPTRFFQLGLASSVSPIMFSSLTNKQIHKKSRKLQIKGNLRNNTGSVGQVRLIALTMWVTLSHTTHAFGRFTQNLS